MSVYELPPRDCFSKLVSFDSLYGMNVLSLLLFFSFSVKAVITLRSTCRDLLISLASFACWPVAPVRFYFSLPARSTSWSFEVVMLFGSWRSVDSMVRRKIQCERDETSFRL